MIRTTFRFQVPGKTIPEIHKLISEKAAALFEVKPDELADRATLEVELIEEAQGFVGYVVGRAK